MDPALFMSLGVNAALVVVVANAWKRWRWDVAVAVAQRHEVERERIATQGELRGWNLARLRYERAPGAQRPRKPKRRRRGRRRVAGARRLDWSDSDLQTSFRFDLDATPFDGRTTTVWQRPTNDRPGHP